MDNVKSYSDTYLYSKYPIYTKYLTNAIMKDTPIDKKSKAFEDVLYEIKRSRVSNALVNILNSINTVLLDCDEPLPSCFKVFCTKDLKSREKNLKVFIDCTGVVTKHRDSSSYTINEGRLISFLIDAGIAMVYHRNFKAIHRRSNMVILATECFAKCFTSVIDYLAKISIQESSKVKVLYLSSMYFCRNVLGMEENKARPIALKVAGMTDRAADMLDIVMEKNAIPTNSSKAEFDPYTDLKSFIIAMRETVHLDKKVITLDMILERWMKAYGPRTVFGLEYFPHFSDMITDAYNGAFLNQQKSIEKICGTSMIEYTKEVISLVDSIA